MGVKGLIETLCIRGNVQSHLLICETARFFPADDHNNIDRCQDDIERVSLSTDVLDDQIVHRQTDPSSFDQADGRRSIEHGREPDWDVLGQLVHTVINTQTEPVNIGVRIVVRISTYNR